MSRTAPNGWYADPSGQHRWRYWYRGRWTDHVSSDATGGPDRAWGPPPPGLGAPPRSPSSRGDIAAQVAAATRGTAAHTGGGTIATEPVLVFDPRSTLLSTRRQWSVLDQHGAALGTVRQVGGLLGRSLEVADLAGTVLLRLGQPLARRATLTVAGPTGDELGCIVKQSLVGPLRFTLESRGRAVGSMHTSTLGSFAFDVVDPGGEPLAWVTGGGAGLAGSLLQAERYIVQFDRPLDDPERSLVVAAVAAVVAVDRARRRPWRGLRGVRGLARAHGAEVLAR